MLPRTAVAAAAFKNTLLSCRTLNNVGGIQESKTARKTMKEKPWLPVHNARRNHCCAVSTVKTAYLHPCLYAGQMF